MKSLFCICRLWPDAFTWFTPSLFVPALGFLMFAVGVNLSLDSFVEVFKAPQVRRQALEPLLKSPCISTAKSRCGLLQSHVHNEYNQVICQLLLGLITGRATCMCSVSSCTPLLKSSRGQNRIARVSDHNPVPNVVLVTQAEHSCHSSKAPCRHARMFACICSAPVLLVLDRVCMST